MRTRNNSVFGHFSRSRMAPVCKKLLSVGDDCDSTDFVIVLATLKDDFFKIVHKLILILLIKYD